MSSMNKDTLEKLGIKIGHYTDKESLTGTTVFIAEKGADIGIDVRGSNTGVFNIPSFRPKAIGDRAHAVVLTGGSTFGLESAFGVMQYLEENKIGFRTRAAVIPSTTGAVIYDIAVGNAEIRPGKKEGFAAGENASFDNYGQGNIGVGTGATVGKWFKGRLMRGGFGMSVVKLPEEVLVAAFVVTNSVGDVVNPDTGKFYFDDGNFDLEKKITEDKLSRLSGLMDLSPTNTTLGVIATNVSLDKNQLMKVAELAHDGMARSIFPVHTMMDGDVVFALSSRSAEERKIKRALHFTVTDVIGLAAADALGKAIKNSILNAESIEHFPAYE